MHPPSYNFIELVNKCVQITHYYLCGHNRVDKAGCAVSKRRACGVLNNRSVHHETKCFDCGEG
ncbi:hypothetical protein BDY17DRAFT_324448 [Neohortaea acidophila]|uniref:Uncharacterized protein n=1 Tax=Neohortaea acidophila TaxID=245834 RepID=A0A6A6PUF9_9PEZI|nr:uncharacterized protein BDY17DRAFT_324448 [Neohortaea acidophila]KAF2483738.1 hypothetical protein BDY17DRAFT_324448 [Neohortaea acidophila]